MTDLKEFESLDELFKKTFDNLPDTPAKSGWDTPSEQVWQHVQKQIRPPQSGWSTQTITLIAAFAVTLTVGLYLFLNRPVTPETPIATPPPVAAETTEQSVAAIQEQVAETQPAALQPATLPAKFLKKKPAATSEIPLKEETEAETAKAAQADSSAENAQKPSGKKIISPNTTERLKAELSKRAEEAWKTPLQTLPQRWPGKSN